MHQILRCSVRPAQVQLWGCQLLVRGLWYADEPVNDAVQTTDRPSSSKPLPSSPPPAQHPQVYAQGMSVAAKSALVLDGELAAAPAAVGGKASGTVDGSGGGQASGKAGGKVAENNSISLEAGRAAVQGMGPTFQKHLVRELPLSAL